jgi:hypothetical protein
LLCEPTPHHSLACSPEALRALLPNSASLAALRGPAASDNELNDSTVRALFTLRLRPMGLPGVLLPGRPAIPLLLPPRPAPPPRGDPGAADAYALLAALRLRLLPCGAGAVAMAAGLPLRAWSWLGRGAGGMRLTLTGL